MPTDVVVTGMGCVSPLGLTVEANRQALWEGRDALNRARRFESRYASLLYFGEVDQDDEVLLDRAGLSASEGHTRTDALAVLAFAQAVADAGLSPAELADSSTALISASTVGGMCMTNQLYKDSNLQSDTKAFLESYSASAHAIQLVKRYGIKGLVDVINTACSSSANAIMNGVRLIRTGRARRVIVGGVDSLSKYTVNGFNSLQILSEEKCRPFDAQRKGLNLGEGAGFLVLELAELAGSRPVYAKVAGWGNANDAFHTSSMSDQATGVLRAMQMAVEEAGIIPAQIDYINAHGTGTLNNDQVELTGFASFFEKVPPFASTKSYVGHTLGAAGALEAIYSILALMHDEMYGSLNFETPIEGLGLCPLSRSGQAPLQYVMSNSYGFSGNCTSLIFQKA